MVHRSMHCASTIKNIFSHRGVYSLSMIMTILAILQCGESRPNVKVA